MKKILLVNQDQFGYHIDTYEYAKYLKDYFAITFYCWDYGLPKIHLDGVEIIYMSREYNVIKRNLLFRLELLKLLARRFDVVFIKYYIGASLVHLVEKQNRLVCDMRTGNVRFSTLRRVLFDAINYIELLTFRNITFISKSLAARFKIKNYHLLPLGANPMPSIDKNFNALKLLYIGTFSGRKIEDTVRGFGIFYQKYKHLIPCNYEIIGSGTPPEIDRIKQAIQEFQLENIVILKGYIPHDELTAYLKNANIGVSYIPITKFYDCQPATKTFEYLQGGMPVLATATKENKFIINAYNGALIEDTPQSFAQGLETIYENRFSYRSQEIQNNAKKHSWESIVRENLYPYLNHLSNPLNKHEKQQKHRILFITNMFPTKRFPVFGIFVKEQVDGIISNANYDVDIMYINAKEKGKLEYLKSVFSIRSKIKKGNYDVIHIHYGLSALFMLFFKPKSKVFLTLHGADILIKQKKRVQVFLTKKIVRKVDKVFILNKEMEEITQSLKVNYEMLPCGVNIDFFKPNGSLKNGEKSRLIVFPGSPQVGVKNFPLFQQVMLVLSQKSNYKIDFECVVNMTRAEVKDLLNKADCLLMTSISEGSPQIVKEALACGLPVVSVPVGDVKSMVEDVPHCYVSETYLPQELSDLVLRAFEGKQYAYDIKNAFISKKIYDNHSVTQRLIENYTHKN